MSEILQSKPKETVEHKPCVSEVKKDKAVSVEIARNANEQSDIMTVLSEIIATGKAKGAKKIKIELEF